MYTVGSWVLLLSQQVDHHSVFLIVQRNQVFNTLPKVNVTVSPSSVSCHCCTEGNWHSLLNCLSLDDLVEWNFGRTAQIHAAHILKTLDNFHQLCGCLCVGSRVKICSLAQRNQFGISNRSNEMALWYLAAICELVLSQKVRVCQENCYLLFQLWRMSRSRAERGAPQRGVKEFYFTLNVCL